MLTTVLTVAAWAAVTGVLNLLIGHKSQVNAWAESHPRVAAVLKLCRAVGLDPWMIIQSLSLVVKGKLPESIK